MYRLNYNLLFLDLDGTLLSAFKKIPKKNLYALQEFSSLGGEVVISTGKTYLNAKKYIKQINKYLEKPIEFCACLNGNIIYDLRNGKEQIIYEGLINNNDCKEIYHVCKRNKLTFAPYTKIGIERGKIHSTSGTWFAALFKRFNNWNITKLRNYQPMQSYKINIFTNLFSNKKLYAANKELANNPNIEILKTKKYFYEIVAKNSNKANAVKIICHALKRSIAKTAAIGDSANDVPMFQVVGLPVSVGIDNYELRKYCHYYVKQKRNKVYWAIKNFVI